MYSYTRFRDAGHELGLVGFGALLGFPRARGLLGVVGAILREEPSD